MVIVEWRSCETGIIETRRTNWDKHEKSKKFLLKHGVPKKMHRRRETPFFYLGN